VVICSESSRYSGTAGIKAANKISLNHVNFHKHKMKVKLAAQILSKSVADALDFLHADINKRFVVTRTVANCLSCDDCVAALHDCILYLTARTPLSTDL
jgi:hypothetical protein